MRLRSLTGARCLLARQKGVVTFSPDCSALRYFFSFFLHLASHHIFRRGWHLALVCGRLACTLSGRCAHNVSASSAACNLSVVARPPTPRHFVGPTEKRDT